MLHFLSRMHAEPYLNKLFSYARNSRNLQHSNDPHLVVPMTSFRHQKYSPKRRGAKLINRLVSNRIIAGEISFDPNEHNNSVHQLTNLFFSREQ